MAWSLAPTPPPKIPSKMPSCQRLSALMRLTYFSALISKTFCPHAAAGLRNLRTTRSSYSVFPSRPDRNELIVAAGSAPKGHFRTMAQGTNLRLELFDFTFRQCIPRTLFLARLFEHRFKRDICHHGHRTSSPHVHQQRWLTLDAYYHSCVASSLQLLCQHGTIPLSDKNDQRSTDPHCTFNKALATKFGLHLADPRLRHRRVMHLTKAVVHSYDRNSFLNSKSPHMGISTSSACNTLSTPASVRIVTANFMLLHLCNCRLFRTFLKHSHKSLMGLLLQSPTSSSSCLGAAAPHLTAASCRSSSHWSPGAPSTGQSGTVDRLDTPYCVCCSPRRGGGFNPIAYGERSYLTLETAFFSTIGCRASVFRCRM